MPAKVVSDGGGGWGDTHPLVTYRESPLTRRAASKESPSPPVVGIGVCPAGPVDPPRDGSSETETKIRPKCLVGRSVRQVGRGGGGVEMS